MNLSDIRRNIELVGIYRNAFGYSSVSGDMSPLQKAFIEDLEQFCGLRQAKFTGSEHEMIKNLGRIEVLGRINFYLNYDDNELAELQRQVDMAEKELEDE